MHVRTEQIRVRVTPEEHAAIRRRAERDGRTVSGYVRHASLVSAAPPRREKEREREEVRT
jgi:uncharacterized protein (DUF1778 family)